MNWRQLDHCCCIVSFVSYLVGYLQLQTIKYLLFGLQSFYLTLLLHYLSNLIRTNTRICYISNEEKITSMKLYETALETYVWHWRLVGNGYSEQKTKWWKYFVQKNQLRKRRRNPWDGSDTWALAPPTSVHRLSLDQLHSRRWKDPEKEPDPALDNAEWRFRRETRKWPLIRGRKTP